MLTKLRTLASLYRELGLRWAAFRVVYALRLRTGLVRSQMPQYQWDDRPLETWLKKDIPSDAVEYAQWRKQNSPQFFFDQQPAGRVGAGPFRPVPRPSESPPNLPWNSQTAIDEADRLLNGGIKYFAHEFHQTGFPPYWHEDYFSSHVTLSDSKGSLSGQSEALRSQQSLPHTVPASLRESDMNKHWSQISDDNVITRRALALPDDCEACLWQAIPNYEETASAKTKSASQRHYDIKFIWEPNRFAFVYTLVRAYVASHDEKYAEAFWISILDWAEHNPPNTGPNWMDGQEIALRLMAWTFGYYQFSNSPSATPQRIASFTQFVAAQAERIYKNIDYAISTRSNHTISEAFGLWLIGLLFPELKDSEKYSTLGRELLEGEARTQIFPDGSYSMYSINYQRFILHIYLYAIRLGEINNVPFSHSLYASISSSIEYLVHLIDPQTGQMPVYGSNDGAFVLPLNNCDFTDYRPLLQLGWYITKKEFLFEPGPWDEDIFWLCGVSRAEWSASVVEALEGKASFPNGGVYLLRSTNSHALIRCTDFRARPSHADQLHVDLWIHGYNLACDAGTYLYSGEGRRWRNGLARTSVHNTVIVDGKDQMTLVSRFTWTNWSKGKVLQHNERIWEGEHDSYKPVSHRRTVMALDDDRWLVLDRLSDKEPHQYALQWLLCDFPFAQKENSVLLSLNGMKYRVQVGLTEGNGQFSIMRADPNSTRGWRSRYYGHKEPAISLMLEANQPRVTFWTFFGFENDVVEIDEKSIQINSMAIPLAK